MESRTQHPGGTCGAGTDRLENIISQPTTATLTDAGCTNASITYSADNCTVTYDSTCPEDSQGKGGKLRVNGSSHWDSASANGTAVEQWLLVDKDGKPVCVSTYDVVLTKK